MTGETTTGEVAARVEKEIVLCIYGHCHSQNIMWIGGVLVIVVVESLVNVESELEMVMGQEAKEDEFTR